MAMEEPLYENDYAAFCVAYTRAIVAWNNAEEAAREILTSLSAGGVGSTIAIYQLGNASLVDAIRTVCQFIKSIENDLAHERADHVEHFAEGLDRLRSYRNFYVHQTRGVGKDADHGDYRAILFGLDVKGGYSYIKHELTMADLAAFTRHCFALEQYGQAIARVVTRNALARYAQPEAKPLASLQKPTWPDRLKRSRESLLKPLRPSEPSGG
ncbi:hypothetical protein N0B51_00905 [Tsuneonella sp. YG55]|uniref:Uncharacterized protein n=1 Tax=Tsuneonella litorea TaxID=2976475 RepID=A0A9X2W017_9SPHN|nr:hypothetical protein [Tsuneonella litorea]MCT2557531.1 hypothetical protein [Tsuneonella litorea]